MMGVSRTCLYCIVIAMNLAVVASSPLKKIYNEDLEGSKSLEDNYNDNLATPDFLKKVAKTGMKEKKTNDENLQEDFPLENDYLEKENLETPDWLKKITKANIQGKVAKTKRTPAQTRSMFDITNQANQDILQVIYDWQKLNGSGTPQVRFGRSVPRNSDYYRKPERENFENSKRQQKGRYERSLVNSAANRRILRYFFRIFRKGGRLQFRFG